MKRLLAKIIEFIYRLFFTRDDDLDILQVLFAAIIVVTLCSAWFIVVNAEADTVKIEALVTLRWITGLLIITAVPKWLVPSMIKVLAKNRDPSEVQPHDQHYPNPGYDPYPRPYMPFEDGSGQMQDTQDPQNPPPPVLPGA